MQRTLLVVSLLLIPGGAFAAKNEAQIKALKAQIEKARHDEAAALKQVDEQTKTAAQKLEKPEEHEKQERARLHQEEEEALKRIDERFDHALHTEVPKQLRQQLEQALQTLEHIRVSVMGHADDLNFHGRGPVMKSVRAAEAELKRSLGHIAYAVMVPPGECRKAAEAIHAAHREIEHCLSINPVVNGSERGTAKGAAELAATTQLLRQDLGRLDSAHREILTADREIEHQQRQLLEKKNEEKKKTREEFKSKAEHLTQELHQQRQQAEQLVHHKEEHKKQIKEQYAAQIKGLEQQLKQLEKAKPSTKKAKATAKAK